MTWQETAKGWRRGARFLEAMTPPAHDIERIYWDAFLAYSDWIVGTDWPETLARYGWTAIDIWGVSPDLGDWPRGGILLGESHGIIAAGNLSAWLWTEHRPIKFLRHRPGITRIIPAWDLSAPINLAAVRGESA